MPYQFYRELGLAPSPGEYVMQFAIVILVPATFYLSWHLLRKGQFRGHILFILAVAALLVLGGFAGYISWVPAVLFVLYLWDHVRARAALRQAPISPKKMLAAKCLLILLLGGGCALGWADAGEDWYDLALTLLVFFGGAAYVASNKPFTGMDLEEK